jgi:hypothetical protein
MTMKTSNLCIVAVLVAVVACVGNPAWAVNFNGAGDGVSWEDPDNWTSGSVPMNENVFLDFGPPIFISSTVPDVNDVYMTNNFAQATPQELRVTTNGVLNMANGQMKLAAFNNGGVGAPAVLRLEDNAQVTSRWGLEVNPLGGTLTAEMYLSGTSVFDTGTRINFSGGAANTALVYLSDDSQLIAPDGLWDNGSFGGPFTDGKAVITLSGNASLWVGANSGVTAFPTDAATADYWIAQGVITAASGVIHQVAGDYRVFTAIPEPSAILLVSMGVGLLCMGNTGGWRRRGGAAS